MSSVREPPSPNGDLSDQEHRQRRFVLLGAGRELIRLRDQGRSGRADDGIADDIAPLPCQQREPAVVVTAAMSRMVDRIGGPKGEQ